MIKLFKCTCNWNNRIPLWVTNGSDSFGESFDFLSGNIFCFESKYFSSSSRGREGSHDESERQTEAWLGWAHSEFVHPFIHQLMDDWAWQAWQYHHPTISQSDTPRATHCNLITERNIYRHIKSLQWSKIYAFIPSVPQKSSPSSHHIAPLKNSFKESEVVN